VPFLRVDDRGRRELAVVVGALARQTAPETLIRGGDETPLNDGVGGAVLSSMEGELEHPDDSPTLVQRSPFAKGGENDPMLRWTLEALLEAEGAQD
jgi:hypothetical protein